MALLSARRTCFLALMMTAAVALAPQPAAAQPAPQAPDPLWTRSLDELMQVEVVSVGKKEERVFESAGSVYVVTSEQIRRSGLTTVAELLRLVPGMTVSRIDASKWSVSVRGFAGRFAGKLLVMIDGRSLYSRMFSGVFWDALGVPVDEVERIEVIRGPGASLWGTNAVNGVINIVTRQASSTKGTRVSAQAGVGVRWSVGAAHQRSVGVGNLRLFAEATQRDGYSTFDQWRQAMAGARFHRGEAGGPAFRLDLSAGRSEAGHRSTGPRSFQPSTVISADGQSVTQSLSTVARWTWPGSRAGEWQVTALHDWLERQAPGVFGYSQHIADLNMQHRFRAWNRHDFVWGGGVRYRHDDVNAETLMLSIDDPRFGETLVSAFVQDQISLTRGLKLTLGTKVERTDISEWNLQPTIRGWWSPDGTTALWGAVSRALRTPARADTSIRLNLRVDPTARPLPVLYGLVGNPDAGDEELTAYEAGLRTTFSDRVAVDISGFYNRYRDLIVRAPQAPRLELDTQYPPHVLAALRAANGLNAQTAGFETALSVAVAPRWHIVGTAEIFRLTGWETTVPGATPVAIDGATPRFQWTLRSSYSAGAWDTDTNLIAASALPEPRVPGYLRLDARIGRRLAHGLELAIVGQNLLQAEHLEAATDTLVATTPVGRTASLRATWRFGGM